MSTTRRAFGLPFFSVIIPTHSRPAELARCLEAIARLDYPRDRFEVIVVDDGSLPPLEGAEAPFRDRLDIRVRRQENAGPAAARNAGAAMARGEFLAFTDDDCAPEPGWLMAFAARFAEAGDRAFLGGRTINALADNAFSSTSQAILDVVYAHYNADLQRPLFFASNNLAMQAGGFRTIGGFDERFRTSEDRELCHRLTHDGGTLIYAPEARILHAHWLTLGGFWGQHFHYGRGAFRFHASRAQRGTGRLAPDLGFYRKLFLHPFTQMPLRRALGRMALILVAQMANTAGFFREGMTLGNRALKNGDGRPV